ncbi:MAG: IS1 family transposase [Nitrososphaerota archaeon]|nr:IS1 family transposase [Nitrososphaerota archaeon]
MQLLNYSAKLCLQNSPSESIVTPSKRNTQCIERKHLSLRTWCSRLVRRGIRFSKSTLMHKTVVGMVINF